MIMDPEVSDWLVDPEDMLMHKLLTSAFITWKTWTYPNQTKTAQPNLA